MELLQLTFNEAIPYVNDKLTVFIFSDNYFSVNVDKLLTSNKERGILEQKS